MLPLEKVKCPCCIDIIHIPIELIYTKNKCQNLVMNFLNFTIINTIFKYIQIYSIYHELSDFDLHVIDFVAVNFNLEEFKNYLKNVNFVKNDNLHLKKMFDELFNGHFDLFHGEKQFLPFKKNFFKSTCIKDNIKIYSILIYIRYKTYISNELLIFDKIYIKIIEKYFNTNNIRINKLRKLNKSDPYSHVGKLLYFLNLNVTENYRLNKKKKNIKHKT